MAHVDGQQDIGGLYRRLWGSGVEQKMLNDYNAAKLGILDSSYIESYKVFLNDRKSLKERVDGDFLDWENG